MFSKAIVRKPGRNIINAITSQPGLGRPDYEVALVQHAVYVEALEKCGLEVIVLEAEEDYPDSCFIEDPAVITSKCAILTNPGAPSRNGEIESILPILKEFFPDDNIEYISAPGTLEGGDVMMVGNHFYVGCSARTNGEGARQFIDILHRYGFDGTVVPVKKELHLKSGVNYLENNNVLIVENFLQRPELTRFNHIVVPQNEAYAANCLWINGSVLVPKGYPTVENLVRKAGYPVILIDVSEFTKLDGGVSCLSLRF